MSRSLYRHTMNLPLSPSIVSAAANPNDYFGWSLAVSGNYTVIGARDSDTPIKDCGSVHIYTNSDDAYHVEAVLTPMDYAQSNDAFGSAVAIDAQTVVVGACKWGGQGAVFVYTKKDNDWTLTQQLTAQDANSEDEFGYSVAIYGPHLLVGARSWGKQNEGAVYVFSLIDSEWTETQCVHTDCGQLGYSLAISEGVAVAGAPSRGSGAAYVLNLTESGEWTIASELTCIEGCAGDQFGFDVAIDANMMAISAPGYSSSQVKNGGAVFMYEKSSEGDWVTKGKLIDSLASVGEAFGSGISLSRQYLLVGGWHFTCPTRKSEQCGSASLFKYDESSGVWSSVYRYMNSNAQAEEHLGHAVALAGNRALISARNWSSESKKRVGCVFVSPISVPVAQV
jgi:FG-GAP repeat